MKKKMLILVAICCLFNRMTYAQSKTFEMDGHVIPAATCQSFNLSVKAPNGDHTFMPITIINGAKEGPVLGLTAGIHGYEYPPIMAMQQLPKLIDVRDLAGTIVIVHIANMPAFLGRSVYYNPVDGKNLNRQFPGDKNGSLTDCMAYAISNRILPKLDYFVDVHAGDASEDLYPYIGYTVYGEQTATGRAMAEAMGFDWIMRAEVKEKTGPSGYCSREAIAQGIPTIAIECGKLGRVKHEEVQRINEGLINVMRLIRLLPGEVIKSNKPLEISQRTSLYSKRDGILISDYKSGQLIRKGTKIGYLTDFYGHPIEDVISPIDGVIIYMIATPPVNNGDLLFNLGVVPNEVD